MNPLYIGDLSKFDAVLLTEYASKASRILEFGCGASTQIMAQVAPQNCEIISLDTELMWMETTERILRELGVKREVKFMPFDKYKRIGGKFDFIFNDGLKTERVIFGNHTWRSNLKVGGHMMIHDTRNPGLIHVAKDIFVEVFNSVESVEVNKNGSNMTILKKGKDDRSNYYDWNVKEKKELWMKTGTLLKPADWMVKLRKQLCK